mgnify:FL=1
MKRRKVSSKNFIEHIIDEDLEKGFDKKKLKFRFPPEPNGYLHIGHVKAICLNFELGKKYNAPVNLRFDDTNPVKENKIFVEAIKDDISWLQYKWEEEKYASDYFQQLYLWALELIKKGKAYVDNQSTEQIALQKGTPTRPGQNSPFRNQSPDKALSLFIEMKEGKHPEGSMVLRFKGNMSSSNMLMRDPVLYRILKKPHHRTKDKWCIYPMYDWAHGQSDYIEEISHSLCTLEFLPHRELYNEYLNFVYTKGTKPKQREFSRLNLSYTVTSKRKLQKLVENSFVEGWDDPRMPTISGLRRRGYTPTALINFAKAVGVAKRDNVIDASFLEFCAREDLNKKSRRVMVVLDPIKVIITNYPENKNETLLTENNPEDSEAGEREIHFSKELFIERNDFRETANRKFFRLKLGGEVRLKSAYIIKAQSLKKNDKGEIDTVYCTYDPLSLSGSGTDESQRKVKGTLHWVSQKKYVKIKVNQYDRLFTNPNPDSDKEQDFTKHINPYSLITNNAFAEISLKKAERGTIFQFQRQGYFICDKKSTDKIKIFNKTVSLRDTWTKNEARPKKSLHQ